jgi:hypothetical protein
MADQLKTTQIIAQVEVIEQNRLKTTQITAQVELVSNTETQLSQLHLLVDYNSVPLITASQIMLQVEYEEASSYTGTPPASWVKVVGVPPTAVLQGQVVAIASPSWVITKALNPVVNKPAQLRLMRHGKYYFANVEKPYYWAGHDV